MFVIIIILITYLSKSFLQIPMKLFMIYFLNKSEWVPDQVNIELTHHYHTSIPKPNQEEYDNHSILHNFHAKDDSYTLLAMVLLSTK